MNAADGGSKALGFASWVFTGRGRSVTLFQVIVVLDSPPAGAEPAEDSAEGKRE